MQNFDTRRKILFQDAEFRFKMQNFDTRRKISTLDAKFCYEEVLL